MVSLGPRELAALRSVLTSLQTTQQHGAVDTAQRSLLFDLRRGSGVDDLDHRDAITILALGALFVLSLALVVFGLGQSLLIRRL